jgi:pectinesterase
MGPQIRAVGWMKWHATDQEKDLKAFYGEFESTGPGAIADKRVEWSKQLTQSDAEQFSKENFLKGDDNWMPWKENPATQP